MCLLTGCYGYASVVERRIGVTTPSSHQSDPRHCGKGQEVGRETIQGLD